MSILWESETIQAIRAAVKGAQLAQGRQFENNLTHKESMRDVVTAADLAIEHYIRSLLDNSDYGVIGEEFSLESRRSLFSPDKPFWVVDPIDGTVNYVNGFDYYAVSVGLATTDDFLLGAVCLPDRKELFSTLGKDLALLNGRVINHVHKSTSESLIAASFSSAGGDSAIREAQFSLFGELDEKSRGCLRLGSAAANICYTAVGRFQASYGFGARIWDVAAALAIAARAGCSVWTSRSVDGLSVDYAVGSREAVTLIRERAGVRRLINGAL